MARYASFFATAVLGLALTTACGTTPTGTGGNPTDTITVKTNPSFATDVQGVFDLTCNTSNCHGVAGFQGNGNLDLRAAGSYTNLVNVMGDQEAIVRVIPNDANNSYLVIKLEGRQSVGSAMPKGASAISSAAIQNIKNWINQGAQNN